MKRLTLLLVVILGAYLVWTVQDLPDWGDPASPASTYLSTHYIQKGYEETSVPNLVTAVLADYRSYDTMFETVVVFCAGLAVLTVLRRTKRKKKKSIKFRPQREGVDIILQNTARLIVPPMQLFALYVIAHGHHSPGGGFQGGVILGTSFILLALAYDLKSTLKRFKENTVLFYSGLGVLIYAGIGVVSLLLGGNFLAYAAWSSFLGITEVEAHSHGMLGVEIGVAFTVMAIMFSLYLDLASGGDLDEGL